MELSDFTMIQGSALQGMLLAGFTAWLLVWLLKPTAYRFSLLDRPSGRKAHEAPTPVTGGLAMTLGVAAGGLVAIRTASPELTYLLLGMAWLLAVFLIPSVGFVLFLLFGNFRLSKRRREQQEAVNHRVRSVTSELSDPTSEYSGPEWVRSAGELNHRLGSLPMVDGNKVELIPGYEESIKAMTEAIRGAKSYINAEFYIMSSDYVTDELLTELENATERGVTVRLLFDHIGTLRIKGYRRLKRRLKASKIQWRPMLPLLPIHGQWRRPDLRNHRKILVIDGLLAFTGSQNLIEPSYNNPKHRKVGRKWVELMARLEGPIVPTLNVVFATDWLSETDESLEDQLRLPEQSNPGRVTAQVVPSGPGFSTENNLRLFNTLIYSAQHRISICSIADFSRQATRFACLLPSEVINCNRDVRKSN